jgi:hypothetical protein
LGWAAVATLRQTQRDNRDKPSEPQRKVSVTTAINTSHDNGGSA